MLICKGKDRKQATTGTDPSDYKKGTIEKQKPAMVDDQFVTKLAGKNKSKKKHDLVRAGETMTRFNACFLFHTASLVLILRTKIPRTCVRKELASLLRVPYKKAKYLALSYTWHAAWLTPNTACVFIGRTVHWFNAPTFSQYSVHAITLSCVTPPQSFPFVEVSCQVTPRNVLRYVGTWQRPR